MSTLTIRIQPSKRARLRTLAQARGISLNKLIDELATVVIAHHDAETRFRARAAHGRKKKGSELLNRLDAAFSRKG